MKKSRTISAPDLIRWKQRGSKIPVLTCYDFTTARILDHAGVPVLLVGDSLGQVILGHDTTLRVTLAEMIHHTRAVARARPHALVVADMPFMTYQVSPEKALEAAGRLVQEGHADAVKLEGGERSLSAIEKIVTAGIPVMGHLGLTPQSVLAFGGYKVQGRCKADQETLLADALKLEGVGCFGIVLESLPASLGARITAAMRIPTIGIGAGPDCDGQVLVLHDMLGLFTEFQPRFVRRFLEGAELIEQAVTAYREAVEQGTFPGPAESYEPEE